MADNTKHTPENLEWIGQSEDERAFDEMFASRLRAAMDERVTLGDEDRLRMLSALQQAADESGRTDAAAPAFSVAASNPTPTRKKRTWLKVALPAAACLVVGAIALGIALPNSASQSAPGEAKTGDVHVSALSPNGAAENAVEVDGYFETDEGMYVQTEPGIEDSSFNTEEYSAVQERGFVPVVNEPLSTVSADVDTASYCNVRRLVMRDGYSIADLPSGSVRIEEMLNYFDYNYPSPTGSDAFGMSATVAPCPWNSDTLLLVMGFAAQTPEQAGYTARDNGSNLVFLIDVSGSMASEDKLVLLQDSFATLLDQLGPNDCVSIVTYSGNEEIVLEGASGDDVREILRAIYKLDAHGSTNGEAGLRMAYEVAERHYIDGGVNRIIMASDGDLNVGMTSESELFDFVSEKRESGVYLSVLGFGSGNYKDNKMETLADNGNGSYHYIDCTEEAQRVLSRNLMSNVVPFADDVKVQVEFNPAQVKGYRLIGYENRTLNAEDFLNDEKDAGDVGPGAQFTVAYEIVPADSDFEVPGIDLKYTAAEQDSSSTGELFTCSLRYRAFSDNQVHSQQLVVDSSQITNTPGDDWNFAAAVIEFGMLARSSEYLGTGGEQQIYDLLAACDLNDERMSFEKLVRTACNGSVDTFEE